MRAIRQPKHFWLRVRSVCLGGIVLIGMTAPPVHGGAPADGWVFFPGAASALSFASSSIVLVSGKRTGDGRCSGFFNLSKGPNEPPVGAVELAVNESTCQQQVRVGVLTAIPEQGLGSGYTTSSTVVTDTNPKGGVFASASSERAAHYYVIWSDPVFIQVTRVQENLDWKYDGAHITSIVSAYDSRVWASFTGWAETSHQGPFLYHDSTLAYLSTNDEFYNQPFCGGTWIQYQPITLYGRGNGTASGAQYTYDYGCLANLLSWYSYLW